MGTVKVVYRGPALSKTWNRGTRAITFERGVPMEVEEEFAKELLGMNPEKHTLEQAADYGSQIFELAGATAAPARPAEEVSAK